MAAWQKIIVSGSNAALNSLTLTTALTPANGGLGLNASSQSGIPVGSGANSYSLVGSNGTGQIVRSIGAVGVIISGSFSGSFFGDGSGLSGVSSAPTFKLSGSIGGVDFDASTDTLAFTTASVHGFDLSSSFVGVRKTMTLITPQNLRTTGTPTFAGINGGNISGSTLTLSSVATLPTADGEVMIITEEGEVRKNSIDMRVWGSALVDGTGSATRVAYWSDVDTLTSNTGFTFGSNLLTVNGSTFGANTTIAGDLTVLGTTIQLQITNLNIEDRFIYLNSGSSTGDGGLVVSSGSAGNGVAFGWDDSAARWGIQQSTLLGNAATTLVPEAYMAAVIDVDGGQSLLNYHARNGNIRIQSGEIYIYA